MNKLLFAILAGSSALAASPALSAGINSSDAGGYIRRAEAMKADGNIDGCLDQIGRAVALPMTPEQEQTALYIRAAAMLHSSKDAARILIRQWLERYPESPMRYDATLHLAESFYPADCAAALDVLDSIDYDNLAGARRDRFCYQRGYCLLMLGKVADATPSFIEASRGSSEYSRSARFFLGYIAYHNADYAEAERIFSSVDTSSMPGAMAGYYLSQIYFLRADYSRALSTAKTLLRRTDVEPQFQAEANRIAGESEYALGNPQAAVPFLEKYVRATESPLPSALYILGTDAYEKGDYSRALTLLAPAADQDTPYGQDANNLIGQIRLRDGDYDAAILAFDRAIAMPYDPAVQESAYFNYAVASLKGGRVPFGSAVATFEDFLARFPKSRNAPKVQEYIIASYVTDNNYEAALRSINAMRSPSSATLKAKQHILYTLGSRALAAGAPSRAVDYLTQAQALDASDPRTAAETALVLGEAYFRTADFDKSAANLLRYTASGYSANRAIAWYDLGYTRMAQKKYADAAVDFQRAIDAGIADDILPDAYTRMADCAYYAKDFDRAASLYDRAVDLNPSAGDYPLFQKALMKGYLRDHSEKIALLNQLRSRFPSSPLIPDALLETTESQIQLGQNDSAIETYRLLTSQYPSTAQGRQGLLQMAMTLLNANRRNEALDTYREVISRYPSSDEAIQAADELKRLYAADGRIADYASFIQSVDGAPALDPSEADTLSFDAAEKAFIVDGKTSLLDSYLIDFPEGASRAKALSYLAEAAFEANDFDPAYTYAAELADRYPDNALAQQALFIKASVEEHQGKGNAALRSWQQLRQSASSPAMTNTAHMGVLRVARDLGLDNETIEAADAVIASSAAGAEDKNEAIFSRALALDRKGDSEAARQAWQSIAGHTSDLYGIRSAFSLAQSLADADRLADAEKQAEKITEADSPHYYWKARAFILLADIYTKRGDDFKARQYLKAVRDNYPGTETDIFMMIDQRLK